MNYQISQHDRIMKVAFERTGTAFPPRFQRGRRGEIRGLSHCSRVRLIRYLATINPNGPAFFVTLTYRDYCENFKVWKVHLNRWIDALRKFYPKVYGLWRLEFQARGAPHFHLLIWLDGVDRAVLWAWARERWLAAIVQDSPQLRRHAVQVADVYDMYNSGFYLSLHHAKKNQDRCDIQTGREWGMINADLVPTDPLRENIVDTREVVLLRRLLRHRFRVRNRSEYRSSRYYQSLLRNDWGFSTLMPFHVQVRVMAWITEAEEEELPAQFAAM